MSQQPQLTQDHWLSEILKKDAYQLKISPENIPAEVEYFLKQHSQSDKKHHPKFIFCKLPTTSIEISNVLLDWGYKIIDTNITFSKAAQQPLSYSGNCKIRLARPGDVNGVKEIAKNNFIFSRFHLDPNIDKETANLIKEQWAGNFFTGKRGDQMIVAETENNLVGFLQILLPDVETAIIDLIAVDKTCRGKNVAADMIRHMEENKPELQKVIVGTQAANIQSLRFYEKIGFRIISSQYIFHYHKD